jgi:hypothetical protein
MLLSDALRHSAWDIRSENRPIENDCLSLLARKDDKSIQFGSALHVSPDRQKWERIYSYGNGFIKILQRVWKQNNCVPKMDPVVTPLRVSAY